MKIPSPTELLQILQKTDSTIIMTNIPLLGIVTYGSLQNTYGFTVGIDPETGRLSAKVSNQNVFVSNEESGLMDMPEFLDWFADGCKRWALIPVEGRTGPKPILTPFEQIELDEQPEFEITQQVKDIIDGRIKNVIEI